MAGDRQGISETFPDLENRLLRIQREIESRRVANRFATVSILSDVQTPQNVTVSNTVPGSVDISWDPVGNPDVMFYEIDIATSASFDDAQTFREPGTNTSHLFTGAQGDVTYFVRVRARTPKGFGDYSSPAFANGGQATSRHIVEGGSSSLTRVVQTSFSPATISTQSGPSIGEYGFVEVETEGSLLLVFALMELNLNMRQFDIGVSEFASLFIRLKEDGQELLESEITLVGNSSFANPEFDSTQPGPAIAFPTAPADGNHVYSLEMEVDDSPGDNFAIATPLELTMSIIDLRS